MATTKVTEARRLDGKVVMITGAAGAIGLESSKRLLWEGASLSLIDINPDALSKAVGQLKELLPHEKSLDARILSIVADVTAGDQVAAFTKQTVDTFKRLDCAFLNAGISYASTPIFDTTEEDFDLIMRVNVKSAFLGVREAGKAMQGLGNGGSIILTSSIAGLRGTPGLILYSGSKFALRGFALTAANELGKYNIRVNTLHPSGVDSPMFRSAWSPEKIDSLLKAQPLGRFANVDDISGVVAFLASDDSKFMTGGFLKVDGGCINF